MPEDQSNEYDEHHRVQRQGAGPEQSLAAEDGSRSVDTGPSYPSSLISDRSLKGRGNQPAHTAVLQTMQETYGNRATQRFVQRATAATIPVGAETAASQDTSSGLRESATLAVQREDGEGATATVEAAAPETEADTYGTMKVTQANTDGSSTSSYASDITVTFTPNKKKAKADEIAFVQNVRVVDTGTSNSRDDRDNFKNRRTPKGWTIDRLDARKYGWYGYNNDGRPSGTVSPGSSPSPLKDATMTDRPSWNVPSLSWEFETCAIAKAGADSGTIYGCITWGFDADANNKLTSHRTSETSKPSAEFNDAIKAWNTQAAGPEAKRNATDQQSLGPFK